MAQINFLGLSNSHATVMKYTLSALLLSLTFAAPAWAQDTTKSQPNATEAAKSEQSSASKKMGQDFSNLSLEKRKEFGTKFTKAQNMFNQKRIFDTLEALDGLDNIFVDHPASLNLRGACYVEIRSFAKADAIFQKILKTAPKNTNVLFNLAEIDFVTKKWASAHSRFEKLIPQLPESQKAMLRLCEFKLLLCKLKLDKVSEAKSLMEKYDHWDDSPFYYYARGAVQYHKDEKIEAEKTLRGARFVWRDNTILAPWQDTLIEFGYIRSFYGGDSEDETSGLGK